MCGSRQGWIEGPSPGLLGSVRQATTPPMLFPETLEEPSEPGTALLYHVRTSDENPGRSWMDVVHLVMEQGRKGEVKERHRPIFMGVPLDEATETALAGLKARLEARAAAGEAGPPAVG